jgi:hypothetical protein
MGRVQHPPEEIIGKLREAYVLLGHGTNMGKAIRKLGVSEQSFFGRRKEYAGMGVDQVRQRHIFKNPDWEDRLTARVVAVACQ